MEFENEKKAEEQTAEQQSMQSREGGYQGYRQGRSPRPRIHQQTRPYNQGGYNRNHSQDEGGVRPEGFGAGLQSSGSAPQRSYRPRTSYNSEGGYQPREGGYQPRSRQQYGQQEGGYQPRQGGYQPRPRQQYGQQGG